MNDLISRQAAIERIESHIRVGDELYPLTDTDKILNHAFEIAASCVYNLPSSQPERTCVNCGRTANNGGWYADGGTRCPIEEHYALPKDGFCHLWEKRNVTDDNYPERRTDE